jgi:hypothetical protein
VVSVQEHDPPRLDKREQEMAQQVFLSPGGQGHRSTCVDGVSLWVLETCVVPA